MNILHIPYQPRDLNEEIKKELKKVCDRLKERNGKLVSGEEYELSDGCFYRGMLMGLFAYHAYFFTPPFLRSRKGPRIFVADNYKDAQFYANYYACSSTITNSFEEKVKRETGWNIPNGGALVVEILKDGVKKSKVPPRLDQPGIILENVPYSAITEPCKEYILRELGLEESSFMYKILFGEIE